MDKGQSVDPGRRIAFGDVMQAYRAHVASSKGMGRSKAQALDKIEKLLGARRLIELKTPALVSFAETREREGAGPATILQDFSYIGTVLRHGGALIGAEHAAANAITAVDAARLTLRHSGRLANAAERDRRPTDAELTRLIDHLAAKPRQAIPMIDLTLFAVATAMRLGEIIGLRWEDLDTTARTITIRARKHPTKKATNHQKVPLPLGPCVIGGKVIDPLESSCGSRRPKRRSDKDAFSRTSRKASQGHSSARPRKPGSRTCTFTTSAMTARHACSRPAGLSSASPWSPATAIGTCCAAIPNCAQRISTASPIGTGRRLFVTTQDGHWRLMRSEWR
jgi:integrase